MEAAGSAEGLSRTLLGVAWSLKFQARSGRGEHTRRGPSLPFRSPPCSVPAPLPPPPPPQQRGGAGVCSRTAWEEAPASCVAGLCTPKIRTSQVRQKDPPGQRLRGLPARPPAPRGAQRPGTQAGPWGLLPPCPPTSPRPRGSDQGPRLLNSRSSLSLYRADPCQCPGPPEFCPALGLSIKGVQGWCKGEAGCPQPGKTGEGRRGAGRKGPEEPLLLGENKVRAN